MISTEQIEKLALTCHADEPGTALERWRAKCATGLLAALLGNGRDVTVIVGRRTGAQRGAFHVVREEDRN